MPLREGRDGRGVSPYGILPSLAALPFFALGALLAGSASVEVYEYLTRFMVSLLNAPVTAATGAVLFSFVVLWGMVSERHGWQRVRSVWRAWRGPMPAPSSPSRWRDSC